MENEIKEKGKCLWLFGEPKAGKTTTAYLLCQKKLRNWIIIDGDRFRRSVTPLLDFSREDILKNNSECLKMVDFLTDEGWNVIVSMITPYIKMRNIIKEELGNNVILCYLKCSLVMRETRENYFESDIKFEEGCEDILYCTDFFTKEEVRDSILKLLENKKWI